MANDGFVRPAEDRDRERFIEMMRAFHETAQLPWPFSALHAEEEFYAGCTQASRGLFIYELDGHPAGAILGIMTPHSMSRSKIAVETAWWVSPEARGQAGRLLMDAFEAWAQANRCRYVSMSALTTSPDFVRKAYQARGYAELETQFVKQLEF